MALLRVWQDGYGLFLQAIGLPGEALGVYVEAERTLQRSLAGRPRAAADPAMTAARLSVLPAQPVAAVGVTQHLDVLQARAAIRARLASVLELHHYVFLRKVRPLPGEQWRRRQDVMRAPWGVKSQSRPIVLSSLAVPGGVDRRPPSCWRWATRRCCSSRRTNT